VLSISLLKGTSRVDFSRLVYLEELMIMI